MTNLGTIQAKVAIDMIQWHSDVPDEWHTMISSSCYVPEEELSHPERFRLRLTLRRYKHKLKNGWKNLRKILRESRD